MRNWICLVSEFACLPVTRYPSVEPLQLAAMDSSLNVPEERVEEVETVPQVDENIPSVQDEVPEAQSQAVDDDTSVAEPCCQLTELVTRFNRDFLQEAVEYLAGLPDSRLDAASLMRYLRRYGEDRDALPGGNSDEEWRQFRKSVLQYINGNYGEYSLFSISLSVVMR